MSISKLWAASTLIVRMMMADFCYDCSQEIFGNGEDNDFRHPLGIQQALTCLCEGCGWITVDKNGKRIEDD